MKLWFLRRKLAKLLVKNEYWVAALNDYSQSCDGKVPAAWVRAAAEVVGRHAAVKAQIKMIEENS